MFGKTHLLYGKLHKENWETWNKIPVSVLLLKKAAYPKRIAWKYAASMGRKFEEMMGLLVAGESLMRQPPSSRQVCPALERGTLVMLGKGEKSVLGN